MDYSTLTNQRKEEYNKMDTKEREQCEKCIAKHLRDLSDKNLKTFIQYVELFYSKTRGKRSWINAD